MKVKTTAGHSHAEASWLEERARVVATFAGGAWVETEAKAGCGGCAARQGCASGFLARWRRTPRLALLTDTQLHVGERVTIGLPAGRFLQGALIVYGWPLLLAIVAGGVAERLSAPGHVSVPLAFAGGLALGLLASRLQLRRHQRRYRPCLLGIERTLDHGA
ncbi:positive regulator of sigma(E), RseC/MucC [Modicisalibacter muralis]|uniref:Positive regulator of sigma(E), RseC/MucC n=1 Tax=Modicisalibacter muralis TaxID=119000 RepID=A0A1G9M930_9GAMM|nr:SoxR reducing system RseC family protein [Halomonas muralis]SDL70748.1 positive regulator of sigma(E), RseC/MucC [Halomonas muralis]